MLLFHIFPHFPSLVRNEIWSSEDENSGLSSSIAIQYYKITYVRIFINGINLVFILILTQIFFGNLIDLNF